MFKLLFAVAVSFSLMTSVVMAGDCQKTVMGGGCTAEVSAGVATHMRSQPAVPKAEANAAVKTPAPAAQIASNAGQKQKI